MELHLLPPNIQNECFSERSRFMFCSHDITCGITLSITESPFRKKEDAFEKDIFQIRRCVILTNFCNDALL